MWCLLLLGCSLLRCHALFHRHRCPKFRVRPMGNLCSNSVHILPGTCLMGRQYILRVRRVHNRVRWEHQPRSKIFQVDRVCRMPVLRCQHTHRRRRRCRSLLWFVVRCLKTCLFRRLCTLRSRSVLLRLLNSILFRTFYTDFLTSALFDQTIFLQNTFCIAHQKRGQ